MKKIFKFLGIMMILGLILAVVSFFMGLDRTTLGTFLSDRESYGDQQTSVYESQIETLIVDADTRSIQLIYDDEDTLRVTYYIHKDKDT